MLKNIRYTILPLLALLVCTDVTAAFYTGDYLKISYTYSAVYQNPKTHSSIKAGTTTTISETVQLSSIDKLIDADKFLLEYNAYGTLATNATFNIKAKGVEKTGCTYDEAYQALYDLMLENATPMNSTLNLTGDITTTNLYKVEGKQYLTATGSCTLKSPGKLVFMAGSADACIDISKDRYSQITAKANTLLVFQGCGENRLRICGNVPENTWKGENTELPATSNQHTVFNLTSTVFLASCIDITNLRTNSTNGLISHSGGEIFWSDVKAYDIYASNCYSAFLVFNGGSSRFYLNKGYFSKFCYLYTGSDEGGVIRSYTACDTHARIENSTFDSCINKKTSGTESAISGGAAIHWKASLSKDLTMIVKGCTFTNNMVTAYGGAILNAGNMTVENCTFSGNTSKSGGGAIAAIPVVSTGNAGLSADGISKLTVDSQTQFYGNSTDANGGAIYVQSSESYSNISKRTMYDLTVTIDGTKIQNNTAKGNGGAIAVYQKFNYTTGVTITGDADISHNVASGNGGAVWIGYDNTAGNVFDYYNGIRVENGNIYDNKAVDGGAFYQALPTDLDKGFTMTGGIAKDNTATGIGGGCYLGGGVFTMTGGSIGVNDAGNTSKTGGGVYLANGKFNIGGTASISYNTATDTDNGHGGGVYIGNGTFSQSSGSINGNSAKKNGGGIYMNSGTMTVSGGSIGAENAGNTAAGEGGGLYLGGGSVDMSDGSISYNSASAGNGGGIDIVSGTFSMTKGQIEHNTASGRGGGVFVKGRTGETLTIPLTEGSISYNKSTGACGGGIDIEAGGSGGKTKIIIGEEGSDKSMAIDSNNALSHGAGICMHGSSEVQMYKGSIDGNILKGTGSDGGGVYIESPDGAFNFGDGTICNNTATGNGGGICMSAGGKVTVGNGSLSGNSTTGNGGAVYIKDGSFEMENGYVGKDGSGGLGNSAKNGGGIYVIGKPEKLSPVIIGGGSLVGNTASDGDGGAIYINNGTFQMNGGSIGSELGGNSARNGGGIYLSAGKVQVGSASKQAIFYNNSATANGGALCIDGDLTLSNAVIGAEGYGNSANQGGGVYLTGTGNTIDFSGISKIDNNSASGSGGGFYVSGQGNDINMANEITSLSISNNRAGQSGGGIYLTGEAAGTRNIMTLAAEGASVSNNIADAGNGGAVYCQNSNISINGGTMEDNTALAGYGGAIFADNGTVGFGSGNINRNSAMNGGGVCLANGADMTFADGMFSNNKALANGGSCATDAYHCGIGSGNNIRGVGGGIYVSSGKDSSHRSKLQFNISEGGSLGIYGNEADNGADDIFADGNNTYVFVPDVSSMTLTGFVGQAQLKWYEDFITNDTYYCLNTNNDVAKKPFYTTFDTRFRFTRDHNLPDLRDFSSKQELTDYVNINDRYVCMSIGYTFCDLILRRYGLHVGESSIYRVNKTNDDTGTAKRWKVILNGHKADDMTGAGLIKTDADGNEFVEQTIKNVPVGVYDVTESAWDWAYDSTDPVTIPKTKRQDITAGPGTNVFTFKGDHKVETPMHDESFHNADLENIDE